MARITDKARECLDRIEEALPGATGYGEAAVCQGLDALEHAQQELAAALEAMNASIESQLERASENVIRRATGR
jgi:hypothetical protein